MVRPSGEKASPLGTPMPVRTTVADPSGSIRWRRPVARFSPVPANIEPTQNRPSGIALAVVEAVALPLGFEGDPVGPSPHAKVEDAQPALDRDEQPAGVTCQGQGAGSSGGVDLFIEPRRRVEAMDRASVDVDPVETRLDGAPERALPELRASWKHAPGRRSICRVRHARPPTRPRRYATLSTASAFGPLPSGGSALSETSCSSTYQPR